MCIVTKEYVFRIHRGIVKNLRQTIKGILKKYINIEIVTLEKVEELHNVIEYH